MKKTLFLGFVLFTCLSIQPQAPVLTVKQELSGTLLSTPRSFNKTTGVDTIAFPFSYTDDFTLEVKGKVNAAVGRGLDIEARKKDGTGYRTSITPTKLSWSASLSNISSLAFSTASEQTIRYAVKGQQVHVYQDGIFLFTKNLEDIKDIVNDKEVAPQGTVSGSNLVSGWAGTTGNNSGLPTAYGWESANTAIPWNTANSASGVRYLDVTASSSPRHTLASNGTTYSGRLMTIRWDSNTFSTAVYTFPVTLSAATAYRFSFLYELWANAASGTITVRLSKDKAGTNIIATKQFSASTANQLIEDYLSFTSEAAGQYYLLFSGTYAMFGIGNLDLKALSLEPRIIIGKNYYTGAVDMQVTEVKFDNTGAYAPVAGSTVQNVVITNEVVEIEGIVNKNVSVDGKSELILTSVNPLTNSTVNLISRDAWLYLRNIRPSRVIGSTWFRNNIKIDGKAAVADQNVRVAPHIHGSVIIPYGNETSAAALTVYTGAGFTGLSKSYPVNVYHRGLGDFDNKVKSFKLKKGYAATLANNPDGTGFSRFFIAENEDLEFAAMPEGLEFVSFVRVFVWNWVSKKGWAGDGYRDMTNSTWYYDWDANRNSTVDSEYAPMRHNAGWQSYSIINARENVTTVLGFNEPERPDQANMSVETAINQWPEYFKSGLRIGSPAPSHIWVGWLNTFMNTCDSLNYRVDVAAVHCYEGGQSPATWASKVSDFYNNYAKKRPIWITEFNNGANWTTETWPTDLNEQYQKQLRELIPIMDALDNSPYVERYAFYNWVEEKRKVVAGNSLTPAGVAFAAHPSKRAFNRATEFIHKWKIAPPWIKTSQSTDFKKFNMEWYDHNGETGKYYIIERKLATESTFTPVDTLYAEIDYQFGGNVVFSANTPVSSARYRVRAMSYKNTLSIYSREMSLNLDPVIAAPSDLKGNALGTSVIELTWTAVPNAKYYTLKRATSADGPYVTISTNFTGTVYTNSVLTENTTYYYKISATNNRGETDDSAPVGVTTKSLEKPGAITGFTVASGDARALLKWDMMYDVKFRVYRSETENGEYSIVRDNWTGPRFENTGLKNGQAYYYKVEAFNDLGSVMTAIQTAIPQAGQHVYLSFDENTGDKAYDTWGGYHGTLFNKTAWATGKSNSAVSFNSANQSYVQLETGVVSRLNDFSISTWVYYTSLADNARVFDFGSSTSVFMMFCPKSGSYIRYKITCPAGTYTGETAYTFPTAQWVHLAITHESSTLKIYINGTPVFSDANATVKPSAMGTTTANYLVRSQWSTDPYSTCMIDEFRIYNRALTAAEVNALRNSSVHSVSLNLTAMELSINDSFRLVASVFPDNVINKKIIWSSENPAIAEVDENGNVVAKSSGVTNITATSESGNKSATCAVNVLVSSVDGQIADEALVKAYLRDNILFIDTPSEETVAVYSATGQLITKKEKQKGPVTIEPGTTVKQVLIVKGSSGWVKKIVF